ncbi:MAG: glyoxylate/hydroxypyruvate reductase A [Ahrensia sp.]
MTILLAVTGFDPVVWHDALSAIAPDRPVVVDGQDFDPSAIEYAIVWKQRPGVLKGLPNLKAVFSIGAGVDHIFRDGTLPDVPIARAVAPDLTNRMSEYVLWQVLDHHRLGSLYRRQQAARLWSENTRQRSAADVTVGIMGLGVLGMDAARKLQLLGFNVRGWGRTPKAVDGFDYHHGDNGLDAFLTGCDMVVCLLPLTPQTRGMLSASLFERMDDATVLINAGRGGLQVENDIVAALASGKLAAASLDVFETEPLPADSPLWAHPKVTITPHAAASSMPQALIPPIIAQMQALERGEPLVNLVDREAGY